MKTVIKLKEMIAERGLKVTPQRIAVFEALLNGAKHPTADQLIRRIEENYPTISAGTVYKTLDTFVQNGLIRKVKTDADVMRYDHITDKHHHLYCEESDRIEDYYDEELNKILEDYFARKNIPDFKLLDIKLQLVGNFKK